MGGPVVVYCLLFVVCCLLFVVSCLGSTDYSRDNVLNIAYDS